VCGRGEERGKMEVGGEEGERGRELAVHQIDHPNRLQSQEMSRVFVSASVGGRRYETQRSKNVMLNTHNHANERL